MQEIHLVCMVTHPRQKSNFPFCIQLSPFYIQLSPFYIQLLPFDIQLQLFAFYIQLFTFYIQLFAFYIQLFYPTFFIQPQSKNCCIAGSLCRLFVVVHLLEVNYGQRPRLKLQTTLQQNTGKRRRFKTKARG